MQQTASARELEERAIDSIAYITDGFQLLKERLFNIIQELPSGI